MGTIEIKEVSKLELKVEVKEGKWAEDAQPLAKSLLKLAEVNVVTVEKDGKIVLELADGKELTEETVKKLAKKAGFKFFSLKKPE